MKENGKFPVLGVVPISQMLSAHAETIQMPPFSTVKSKGVGEGGCGEEGSGGCLYYSSFLQASKNLYAHDPSIITYTAFPTNSLFPRFPSTLLAAITIYILQMSK